MTTGTTGVPQTNWRNVNNWHWVEKNCINWATGYIQSKVTDTNISDTLTLDTTTNTTTNISAKITSVNLEGDVSLNQRKGKIITIYDLKLKMDWVGEGGEDEKTNGTLTMEMENDVTPDEFPIDYTCTNDSGKVKYAIKELVRKKLSKAVAHNLKDFRTQLIECHGDDVYIPPEKMNGHPVTKPVIPATNVKPKVEFSATNGGKDGQSTLKGSTCSITQNIEFVCSAMDLYNSFFDANRLRVWTRSGNSVCKPEADSEYALFDGNVTGKILSVEANKKIVMTWRLRSWPANHFSKVEMVFEEGSGSTTLKLKQTEVPIGEKEITTRNWTAYYWNPIKGAFGFGATF